MIVIFLLVSFLLLSGYSYFMIKYIRVWKRTPDFSFSGIPKDIRLSVIVPFFNEEKNIPSLLDSFNCQTLDGNKWEVLFVNDGSDDNSLDLLQEYCTKNTNCRIIHNRGKGKKKALVTGIGEATGDVIITTDADCRFSAGRLGAILKFWSVSEPDMLIMPVVMTGAENFLQRFYAIDFLALQMVTAGAALSGDPLMVNGANMAFARIKNIIDLKESFVSGEDMFLLENMKKTKKKISYLKSVDVLVETDVPETLRQFIAQRSRWISKAGGYRDLSLIFFSLLIFSVNLLTLVFLTLSFVSTVVFAALAVWFGLKTLTDYLLLRPGFRFFGEKVFFPEFAVMQVLYPFYMILIALKGFLSPVKWK